MLAIARERFEGARAELDLLVAEWLTEYLSKTVAVDTPPRWTWTSEWSMHYRRTERTIYISELYLKAYLLSPSKAKRALRWALAHEYWHYVQDVRSGPFGIQVLDFPRMAEYLSDKHAVLLSGISDAEGQSLTVEIVDLVMYYEGQRESPASREFKVRYIDLTTGQTIEETISEAEQYDLYRDQREGKISIIEIKTVR